MEKTVRFEIEGTVIELPLKYDERSHKYLEDYRETIENPVRTREGRPILLTIEDACAYAEMVDSEPTAWNAAPVGISGIHSAHCWACATTRKCAPAREIRQAPGHTRRKQDEETNFQPVHGSGPVPESAARHGAGGGERACDADRGRHGCDRRRLLDYEQYNWRADPIKRKRKLERPL